MLPHLWQFFQAHQDAHLFRSRRGRRTEHLLIGWNILVYAALRAEHRAIADMAMIRDSHLTGHDDVVAGRCRAGDADLRGNDVVLADLAIVRDLYLVVDLRSS